MEFFLDNWFIIIALLAVIIIAGVYIYRFAGLPTEKQLDKVREWLLWAVTSAETELGAGTGQLKLRSVYDMFIQRFPKIAMLITFNTFSDMVDDALVEMREMLAKNEAVKNIVEGE